jgi:toxin CptA
MIKPIEIPLQTSRRLVAILATAHLLAVMILWSLPLRWTMQSSISAVVIVSAALSLRHAMRPQVVALRVNVKGELFIQQCDGDWLEATLLGSSFVAPYLTILNLRLSNKRWPQHVLLMPDVVQADAFRRLRVWLKWGR